MQRFSSLLEKFSAGGVAVAALSCTACFPALGVIAAALGLGVLSGFEGVMINTVLPVFAGLSLLFNGWGWWLHRNHWRGLVSLLGPIAILTALYPLWAYAWSTYLFYAGLILIIGNALADLFWPASRLCKA